VSTRKAQDEVGRIIRILINDYGRNMASNNFDDAEANLRSINTHLDHIEGMNV
jgi:hypothetical protein